MSLIFSKLLYSPEGSISLARTGWNILEKPYIYFQWVLNFLSTSFCLAIIFNYIILSKVQFHFHFPFQDNSTELQHMIFEWNYHMPKFFIPSWILCLDEYISIWMNKSTCLGFFSCPHNPHTKGNKYHTICCGESGIIYGWGFVGVRDHLIPMGRPKFYSSPNMKTVGLFIWLNISLWSTGKVVIIYSSFCVLKWLSQMSNRGVYGGTLVKNRHYCPKGFTDLV